VPQREPEAATSAAQLEPEAVILAPRRAVEGVTLVPQRVALNSAHFIVWAIVQTR